MYERQQHITGTSYSRTLNVVLERLAERVCCLDSSYSLLNVYFRLIWFKSLLLLIYFRCVPNNLSQGGGLHVQRVAKIFPTCDSPGSRSAWCSFIPLQKWRWNHCSVYWRIQGRGPGGLSPSPFLFLDQTDDQRRTPSSPYLRVWMIPRPPEHMDPPLLQC